MLVMLLVPLMLALVALVLPSNRWRPLLLPLAGFAVLLPLLRLVFGAAVPGCGWLCLDALGRLVLLVVGVLFAACSLYGFGYLRLRQERDNRIFVASMLMFLFSMLLASCSHHLGLLWVAVEATTMFSAPLIYFNRNRHSVEATWKYLLICSVGIALAMLGIFLVAYASICNGLSADLQLQVLLRQAQAMAPAWLRGGFVFMLIGFGTKMGLAPMHTWKPDAYGESPGMVGALLASGLTSVAFLAVMRGVQVMAAAGLLAEARRSLLILGISSLLVAALFMLRQNDIKRALAYSSVEHMGILALGVGLGGAAVFAAMFHLLGNAFTKGALFLSAGNIHRIYSGKQLAQVRGALEQVPFSGALLLLGFLAISGSPPFALFSSEFMLLRAAFGGGQTLIAVVVLLLLAVVFIGLAGTLLSATMGHSGSFSAAHADFKDDVWTVMAPLLLLLAVLLVGVYLPPPLRQLFSAAAAQLEVG